jgi:xylulokinase
MVGTPAAAMDALYLGIDIGSSSSKGVLVDQTGRICARAQLHHQVSRPRPGWAEHDAELVWWSDFVALARELTAQATRPLTAVGVSGIGPCFLPIDGASRPLRPAILYGVDVRAQREVKDMTELFGADAILARGGSALSSQAVGPKILWVRRNEPQVWAKTRRFLMASSFLVQRLTDNYILDHHSASQCDPLYDLAAEDWIRDWAEEIGPGLQLPPLAWSDEVAGTVTPRAAAETGIAAGTPVTVGTIDAWAEALSVGVQTPGDTMLMYGTTMFIVSVTDRVVVPHSAIWATAGVSAGSRTLAAGMATSGALTEWFRDLVGSTSFEELLAASAGAPAGSDGLVVLPYFAGERTPIYDPNARGLILGLTLRHGRAEVYRALLEGIAYGVRHIVETMALAGTRPERIVAVGGGTIGELWTRIVSDVTGLAQVIPRESIGAAYGDAMLAARAVGHRDIANWNGVAALIEPDPSVAATYDDLYAVYRALYPATLKEAHALAAIQERSAQ